MTTEANTSAPERMLTTKDLRSMYWRSTFLLGSFNFERMQAIGFCITLMPAIKKFYPDDKTQQAAALKRHLEFYNTHPWISSVVFGVTAAMTIVTGASVSNKKCWPSKRARQMSTKRCLPCIECIRPTSRKRYKPFISILLIKGLYLFLDVGLMHSIQSDVCLVSSASDQHRERDTSLLSDVC